MIQDIMRFSSEELATASDEEVLRAAVQDPGAFEVLVARYEAAFLRKAKSILYSKEDAEEVVQDTFTRIYVYADRYAPQEGASFSSWGYTILTRLAYTRYNKLAKHRKVTAPMETETYERIADTSDFREDLAVKDEVLVALAKLPEAAARVLSLQFLEGKTQEEIAIAEGSTVSAVKTRVHRAKKLFKQALDETA
ncbi:MAG: polymerase, sigma-24 subunit, subfamily [Parcubacteria group bacterium]|nr:polymerase, sigma-24 subunit, subfamily [Parcubacteria group bacterium]